MRQPDPTRTHESRRSESGDRQGFEELLTQLLDEGDDALDRICREHPDMADELLDAYQRIQRLGLLESSRGRTVGPFELGEKLGEGGMGEVYRATDACGTEVTLKLVRHGGTLSDAARHRFEREALVLAELDHPNLPRFVDYGLDEGCAWIALEYIDGMSLKELLDTVRHRGATEPPDSGLALWDVLGAAGPAPEMFQGSWNHAVLAIGRKVAEALAHAHSHRIVHRDVKLANILVRSDGGVVLIDFGLAIDGSTSLTETGGRPGSRRTMSPEQWRLPSRELDQRTDIYSLAVTLFEMFTMRPLFPEEDVEQLRQAIQRGRRASRSGPGLPRDVGRVLDAAMHAERSLRTSDACLLAQNLERLRQGEPLHLVQPPLWRRWSGRRSRARSFVLLGLAAATILGIAGSLWSDRTDAGGVSGRATSVQVAAEGKHLDKGIRLVAKRKFGAARAELGICSLPQDFVLEQVPASLVEPLRPVAIQAVSDLIDGKPSTTKGIVDLLSGWPRAQDVVLQLQRAVASRRLASVVSHLGAFEESRGHSLRASQVFSAMLGDDAFVTQLSYHWIGRADYRTGELRSGIERMREAVQTVERLHPERQDSLLSMQKELYLALMDLDEPDVRCSEILDRVRLVPLNEDRLTNWSQVLLRHVEERLDAGDLQLAEQRLDGVSRANKRHGADDTSPQMVYLRLLRARSYVQQGHLRHAANILRKLKLVHLPPPWYSVTMGLVQLRPRVLEQLADPNDRDRIERDVRAHNNLMREHAEWLRRTDARWARIAIRAK